MIKKIGISLVLISILQASLFADSRVERYHNSKHKTSTHIGSSHAKQYIRPYEPQRYISQHRARPQHRYVEKRHALHHHRDDYRHGGLNYRYRAGTFYRPHNNGYRVVHAPIGAIILTLPNNCDRVHHHDREYYRDGDVYYQAEIGARGYRVVRNPYDVQSRRYHDGEIVRALPYGSRAVIIDNVEHFEYEDSYFLPQLRSGVRVYMVVSF